ncbi:MAG: 4Fe-4S dicluster domain-containing protein [Spirochaetaceae bacterium]|nr:MAG: 4Fe-4S dicluster domain-containing protein [Spirochaetaceae bacterium]
MTDRVLMVDDDLCTGCRICELWCSLEHGGVINTTKSRIRVRRDHRTLSNQAVVCLQCSDRFCIDACPPKTLALSLDEGTGAVLVDWEKCTGCKKCVEACPYDGIHLLAEEKKVILCDLCAGDPECVKRCPEGVLSCAARGED